MGGRWSLVQIQSPRPFLSHAPAPAPPGVPRVPAPAGARMPLRRSATPTMIPQTAYRLAEWLARRLPAAASETLARMAAPPACWVGAPARRALEQNLAAFDRPPGVAPRLARQAVEHFARAFWAFLAPERRTPE